MKRFLFLMVSCSLVFQLVGMEQNLLPKMVASLCIPKGVVRPMAHRSTQPIEASKATTTSDQKKGVMPKVCTPAMQTSFSVLDISSQSPVLSRSLPAVLDNGVKAFVVIVAGPSGSGKTTICRDLKKRLGKDWLHMRLDQFIDIDMPEEKRIEYVCTQVKRVIKDKKSNNILVELVIDGAESAGFVRKKLKKFNTHLGWVYCPYGQLMQRVVSRNSGQDAEEYRRLFPAAFFFNEVYTKATKESDVLGEVCFDDVEKTCSSPLMGCSARESSCVRDVAMRKFALSSQRPASPIALSFRVDFIVKNDNQNAIGPCVQHIFDYIKNIEQGTKAKE